MDQQVTTPTTEDIRNTLGLSSNRRRSTLAKRVAALTLVALVALALGWFYFQSRNSAAAISYETQPAALDDITVTVSATGTIEPISQVEISSEMSGVVREVKVTDNDAVKAGQTLAVLDTAKLDASRQQVLAQIDSAEAKIADAKAGLAQARLSLTRQQSLKKRGLSTTEALENALASFTKAEANLRAMEAALAAQQAQLNMIDTDISRAKIISPINGVILKRSIEPGQTVASSLQAPVLFKIAQDLTRIQLEAAVDEADIGQVKLGQSATFTVDAWRGRQFPAKIERLSFAPETVDGVVTYTAVLSAANEDLALRPGMTATAKITVEDYHQVLTISNEALRYSPPVTDAKSSSGFSLTRMFMPRMPSAQRGKNEAPADGMRTVYVLRNGAPEAVKVKTGASDGRVTLIGEGNLKVDDPVIVAQKKNGAK